MDANATPAAPMQQRSLTARSSLAHAGRRNGDTEIVSRRIEGDIHRTVNTLKHKHLILKQPLPERVAESAGGPSAT